MFLSSTGPIICCPITFNYKELALNFIENLKQFDLHKNIYFLCLDNQIYNELSPIVYCKKNTDLFEKVKDRDSWIELEKFSKFYLLFDVLENHKRDAFMCDVDVVFLKNPLNLFYKYKNYDIVSSSDKPFRKYNLERKKNHMITCVPFPVDYGITDQKKYGFMNGAVGVHFYSEELVKKFKKIFSLNRIKKYPKNIEAGAAQTIYNIEIKKANVSVKMLSVFEIANGSLLSVDYLKKIVMEKAIGIHYNFCNSDPYEGYKEKIRKIKADGFWFI